MSVYESDSSMSDISVSERSLRSELKISESTVSKLDKFKPEETKTSKGRPKAVKQSDISYIFKS